MSLVNTYVHTYMCVRMCNASLIIIDSYNYARDRAYFIDKARKKSTL